MVTTFAAVVRRVRVTVFLLALATAFLISGSPVQAQDGIAVAIVYDTSGSMSDTVKDKKGKLTPKYVIANRALEAIVNRLENVATNKTSPKTIHAALYTFRLNEPYAAVPFGPLDATAMRNWLKSYVRPEGGTPLGMSLTTASQTVMQSPFTAKHVLFVTDGMNTVGIDPASVMDKAVKKQTPVSAHFVAFDVAGKVFAPLKRLGATVLEAANEQELNGQLEFILEEKILLEKEEPKKPTQK